MIPLLVIALALGAAALTYEVSPKAREWIDVYVRAIRGAHAAHRAADEHLSVASTTPDPVTAAERAHEAKTANQQAAKDTAEAAEAARTEEQREAARESAAKVVEREGKIAKLGVGQCDVRTYLKVAAKDKNALLAKLNAEGMKVTGSNPWDIDTGQHDVKLRAAWNPKTNVLKIIVTAGKGGFLGLVTCEAIWERIDPKVKEVVGRTHGRHTRHASRYGHRRFGQ